MKNRTWRLAAWPQGMPKETDWVLDDEAMPAPGLGQILVKAHYLDVAPYMRGRISPRKNYAQGVSPGDVMVGGAVGEVVESRSDAFAVGDMIATDSAFGWREYAALDAHGLHNVRRVDTGLAPLPYWLDLFGINGMTAYFALFDAGALKEKDTVAISAAAGSIGQIAGQLARMAGCRTLGFTSSEEKAAFCTSLGYDDVINYRAFPDLAKIVAQRCPKGVDLFIDNTAGAIHDAVMVNLAAHARVVIVGMASLAARFDEPDTGLRFLRQILVARATMRGFLVADYAARREEAMKRLSDGYRTGKIKLKFDIAKGIEQMPRAFLRLLTSQNIGKQLVEVGT